MKTYIQRGEVIDWTNDSGSAVVSDEVVVIGDIVGVATVDIAVNAVGAVRIEGVVEIAKVDAAVIAAGEHVDWDVSASEVDDESATSASGDVPDFAIAVEGKGASQHARR